MQRRFRTIVLGVLVVSTALRLPAAAQTPGARPGPTQEYVFPAGSGILFFHVRPERAQDFEAVAKRLVEVLAETADPIRRQQAANWNIFRSAETPRDTVIYLFVFDPVVAGADYDPIKILSEAAPIQVQELYERLRADVVRIERMGLTKLR